MLMSIVEDEFNDDEVPFKTFEDLDTSNLPIYHQFTGDLNHYKGEAVYENQHLKNIINKTQQMNLTPCLRTLFRWKNVTCMTTKETGITMILSLRNPNGSATVKLAEPPVLMGYYKFTFEGGFPYYERFAELQLRIFESGLIDMITLLNNKIYQVKYTEDEVQNNDMNLKQLLIAIGIGYFLSLMIFFVEMIYFNFKKNSRDAF